MADVSEVILKLGVDSTGVFTEIDKVKAKYGEVGAAVRENKVELQALLAEEKKLLQLRKEATSPNAIVQYNAKIKETQSQIARVNEELNKNKVAAKQSQTELGKAFDTTGAISLQKQLRILKNDLAKATDPAEINRLAIAAGSLEDKIQDASSASRVFATDSKFESVGTALGDVGRKILSLDFKGAADSSRLLVQASSQITFKNALTGIKDLGTTLLNVGKSLLTNPLFLIGAAVTLIVLNFDRLKNAAGPIGAAFKFIGDIIDGVKNSFFLLTDAIGLTNKAMEDFVSKRLSGLEASFGVTQKFAQREIDIAKAAGKETEKIEIDKLKAIISNSSKQLTLLNKIYKKADDERRNDLINSAFDADTQIKIIEATAAKRKSDADKKAREDFLKTEDQKMEDAQKEADRLSAIEEDIRLRRIQKAIDSADAIQKAGEKSLNEELNERQRHEQAMLSIQGAGKIIQLQTEIDFEKERLENVKFIHGEFSQEYINQNNKIIELEAQKNEKIEELDEESKKKLLDSLKNLYGTSKKAADDVLNAEINRLEKLTQAQQKRVDDATKIAENGNSQLLELEKQRLDDLNKEKEKFVRAQQALAAIELVAETAVMIAKAGAEGGAAAAVTIAAAIIALIAGLASARSIAGQAAFYEGGEGYTGDGNPRDVSTRLGNKDYTYHKREYIFNNEKTSKYINHFRDIHKGKMDLNEVVHQANMYKMLNAAGIDMSRETSVRSVNKNYGDIGELKSLMRDTVDAIKGQERVSVNIDENGLNIIASRYINQQKRLNNLAR